MFDHSVISKAAFSYYVYPVTHRNVTAEKLLPFDRRDVKRDV